ncbi:MAG: hypothetical protein Q8R12_04505 [bacterium]|nr:hypothetical protein [bacterium]
MLKAKFIEETGIPNPAITQLVGAIVELDAKLRDRKCRERFDQKRWPGSWKEFLKACRQNPCSDHALRKKFGITTKGGVSFMYRSLSGEPKPIVIKMRRKRRVSPDSKTAGNKEVPAV